MPRGATHVARTPRALTPFAGFVQTLAESDTASDVPMSYLL
jgi:hypothetical protein